MGTNQNKKILLGTVWKTIEVICQKGSSLIISIIIARLLVPEYFGILAIAMLFVNFADVFVQNGLNIAIISGKKIEDEDLSTAMIMAIGIATIIYSILFVFAPAISSFYKEKSLIFIIRVLLLTLFPKSISAIIKAEFNRKLELKTISLCTIIANISGGLLGILFAVLDFKVWALVLQQIFVSVIECIFLFIFCKWNRSLRFSKKSFWELLSFSKNIIFAGLIEFCGNNCSTAITGAVYTKTDIGYLRKGASIPETIGGSVVSASGSILLPVLSSKQENLDEFYLSYQKVLRIILLGFTPIMGCIASVSNEFVLVFLTDKWLSIVDIMKWFAVIHAINIIKIIDVNALCALGKSKLVFIAESLRGSLTLVSCYILVILLKTSLHEYAVISSIIAVVLSLIIHVLILLDTKWSFFKLFMPIIKTALFCIGAYYISTFINYLVLTPFVMLMMKGMLYFGIYILFVVIFDRHTVKEMKEIMNRR